MTEQLVALSPAEVPIVQQDLDTWCVRKCIALGKELASARRNLTIAKDAGWQHGGFVRQISKTRARMIYFAKIREAVRAGYLVVPNFPVEVMALRLDPTRELSQQGHRNNIDITDAGTGPKLPHGEGRYVANRRPAYDASYDTTDKDGKKVHHELYTASGYDDPDFPVKFIKPEILDATRRAMALKVFDRIGVVRNASIQADPVVLGQILDPESTRWRIRCVSFFVAWWLDPETL